MSNVKKAKDMYTLIWLRIVECFLQQSNRGLECLFVTR